MKIILLGCGRVGSAIAFYLAQQEWCKEIDIIDMERNNLSHTKELLKNSNGNYKFIQADLADKNILKSLIKECALINVALPWKITKNILAVAIEYSIPLLSVTRPDYNDYEYILNLNKNKNHLALLGCGLEPGLTEILATYASQQFDKIEEIHVKCGGIPQTPSPPLHYKVVFGNRLSVDLRNTYEISGGILKKVNRFSGIEKIKIETIGELEAWHDGLLPWITDTASFNKIKNYTQKTLRWPGFSNAVCLLHDLGFFKNDPINIDNRDISVRKFTDAVLKPHIEFSKNDRDLVVLLIQASGVINNQKKYFCIKLIDKFDEKNNLSAMSRTTGYTAGCITELIIQKGIESHYSFNSHELVTGKLVPMLLEKLAKCQISIQMDWETTSGEKIDHQVSFC